MAELHKKGSLMKAKIILVTGAGSGIGRVCAEKLAQQGHVVYASMKDPENSDLSSADNLKQWGEENQLAIRPIKADVQSEHSCQSAVDLVVNEQGRIDVLVNNAGMLMAGPTEAFEPEQFLQILDTNAVSWLRMNRAVLPAMRKNAEGLIVYISSTTAHIFEPLIGPYVASKAAGNAIAEVMGLEAKKFGIDSVIIVPGAFPQGTEHFTNSTGPSDSATEEHYVDLIQASSNLPQKLMQIDQENGLEMSISDVGNTVTDLVDMERGKRPKRVIVDPQLKGVEELNTLHDKLQVTLLNRLGIGHLLLKTL